MSTGVIDSSTLASVVKLVGFVVSWGVSIYFLWVRNPPAVLASDHFFDQTRRISIVVISIFLVLTWGLLANGGSAPVLAWISILATTAGIGVFFWFVARVNAHTAANQRDRSPLLLAGFLAYTTLISWGLTAAVEFIAVILLNPANAQSGVAVVRSATFSAEITITGQATVQTNEDVPFRVTSGQRNFGCGETTSAEARYQLPEGATLLSQAIPSWENTANAGEAPPPQLRREGNTLVAAGTIRGQSFQEFGLGIRNCPAGGHGEVVLKGTYRSTASRDEPRSLVVRNSINLVGNEPVWITLPQPKDLRITKLTIALTTEGRPTEAQETLALTPLAPVAEATSRRLRAKLELESGRVGFSRL